jgi:hypothetical protein
MWEAKICAIAGYPARLSRDNTSTVCGGGASGFHMFSCSYVRHCNVVESASFFFWRAHSCLQCMCSCCYIGRHYAQLMRTRIWPCAPILSPPCYDTVLPYLELLSGQRTSCDNHTATTHTLPDTLLTICLLHCHFLWYLEIHLLPGMASKHLQSITVGASTDPARELYCDPLRPAP